MTSQVIRDVVFAEFPGFRPLTLDLHRPEAAGAPVVVFVHGGGWRLGSRRAFGPNFTTAGSFGRIVEAGFAVVSVDYRLSGEAKFPAQVDDVRSAIAWVREHGAAYSIDASRIVLWGESAGATIAALIALEPEAGFVGVVDWYGPTDLFAMEERLAPDERESSRESEWLGGTAAELPEAARAASPVEQVRSGSAPFLIAHGTADVAVPVTQSEELADALRAAGVSVEFTTVPGAGHMWGGVADTAPLLEQALEFVGRVTSTARVG